MALHEDEEQFLRFAINLGNPVLACLLPNGMLGGITVELAKKIAVISQRKARFITYPTAGRVVDDAMKNQWDIAFLAIDPMREDAIRFTTPYITIESTLMLKNDSEIQSVKDMDRAGMIINVGKGAAYELYLIRTLQHATLQQYPTSQHAIQAFIAGEGDMVASVRQPLEKASKNNPGFRVLPDSINQIHQAICVPRMSTQWFDFISNYLTEWLSDGTVDDIINQHIGEG